MHVREIPYFCAPHLSRLQWFLLCIVYMNKTHGRNIQEVLRDTEMNEDGWMAIIIFYEHSSFMLCSTPHIENVGLLSFFPIYLIEYVLKDNRRFMECI